MIDSIKQFLFSYDFMSALAIYTYWVPLLVCAVTYLFRFVHYYQVDLRNCAEKYYRPNLTIGAIIWHIILTFTPCINMLAMIFDCAGSVFGWLGRTFDTPLVRKQYVENKLNEN